MKRVAALVFVTLLATVWCRSQAAPPQADAGPPKLARYYGSFPAKVIKALDSSKLKEGDRVEVATSGSFKLPDGRLVPKGSKLAGHVTTAKAVSKGDAQSELAITFDKLNIVGGEPLAIVGIVQAVFPPSGELDPRFTNGPMAKESGIGLSGDVKNGSNMDSHSQAQPSDNPQSVGVQGIKDLELAKSGELSSKGKSVKLGVDVRLIVKAGFGGGGK